MNKTKTLSPACKDIVAKIYLECKNETPEPCYEYGTLKAAGLFDGNTDGTNFKQIFDYYEIPELTSFQSTEELKAGIPHCSQEWQQYRLLINRIVGRAKRLKQYKNGDDQINLAMKENRKLWKAIYDGNGYEMSRQTFWWLFLAIHDTIQRRGGTGVWGGNLTHQKFQECIQYRSLLHDSPSYAFNEELYSALFGWW
jgi:hypothetical protein